MSRKAAFIANGCTDPFRLVRAFHFKADARAKLLLEEVKNSKCA